MRQFIVYGIIGVLAVALAVQTIITTDHSDKQQTKIASLQQEILELQNNTSDEEVEPSLVTIPAPREVCAQEREAILTKHCTQKPYRIEGVSMQPAFSNGSTHEFTVGDQCPFPFMIEKDMVVLVDNGQSDVPVAKFLKAMPGDQFALQVRSGGSAQLMVNDQAVTNSVGRPYIIPRSRRAMIELYVRNYKGVIPKQSFLILGDNSQNSRDSSAFGLVHLNDIRGVIPADAVQVHLDEQKKARKEATLRIAKQRAEAEAARLQGQEEQEAEVEQLDQVGVSDEGSADIANPTSVTDKLATDVIDE
jgi:signal peptidase I